MAGTKGRGGGGEMSWIGRKLFLYNVTIGLYAMDWWERYLFSILHFLRTPNFSVFSLSSGFPFRSFVFWFCMLIPYHQSGLRTKHMHPSFHGFHAFMRLYCSSCILFKLVFW
jgi:hypothetical protein